jgi:hypothetical protein
MIQINGNREINSDQNENHFTGPYTVYVAGGIFNQYELASNVLIKESIWKLSNGKFQLLTTIDWIERD